MKVSREMGLERCKTVWVLSANIKYKINKKLNFVREEQCMLIKGLSVFIVRCWLVNLKSIIVNLYKSRRPF